MARSKEAKARIAGATARKIRKPVRKQKPVIIPRLRERLIVADGGIAWARLFLSAMFGNKFPASDVEAGFLLCAVLSLQGHNKPATAHKIGLLIGMPRPTATRKLDKLVERGYAHRKGTIYSVAKQYLLNGQKSLDGVIKNIHQASDALRRVQNEQQDCPE